MYRERYGVYTHIHTYLYTYIRQCLWYQASTGGLGTYILWMEGGKDTVIALHVI
jgi:hypothetical protein